nr:hypothetical protein [Pseudacidovorax intermedius]
MKIATTETSTQPAMTKIEGAVQPAAIRAGKHQGMGLLPQAAPRVQLPELLDGRHQEAEELEDAQEPEDPLDAQVDGHHGMQHAGQDGDEVQDRIGVAHEGRPRTRRPGEGGILRRRVEAQGVLDREHHHRDRVEQVQPAPGRIRHARRRFEHGHQQVGADEPCDGAVEPALMVADIARVQQPGPQEPAQPLARVQGRGLLPRPVAHDGGHRAAARMAVGTRLGRLGLVGHGGNGGHGWRACRASRSECRSERQIRHVEGVAGAVADLQPQRQGMGQGIARRQTGRSAVAGCGVGCGRHTPADHDLAEGGVRSVLASLDHLQRGTAEGVAHARQRPALGHQHPGTVAPVRHFARPGRCQRSGLRHRVVRTVPGLHHPLVKGVCLRPALLGAHGA